MKIEVQLYIIRRTVISGRIGKSCESYTMIKMEYALEGRLRVIDQRLGSHYLAEV